MKKIVTVILILILMPICCFAGFNIEEAPLNTGLLMLQEGSTEGYYKYINARFGFSIDFPKDLNYVFMLPENGDGIRVGKKDESAVLTVSGGHNVFSTEYYKEEYAEEAARLNCAYSVLGNDYYILSYADGDYIFHRKVFFNSEYVSSFTFRYLKEQHKKYEEVTEKIENSFQAGSKI